MATFSGRAATHATGACRQLLFRHGGTEDPTDLAIRARAVHRVAGRKDDVPPAGDPREEHAEPPEEPGSDQLFNRRVRRLAQSERQYHCHDLSIERE